MGWGHEIRSARVADAFIRAISVAYARQARICAGVFASASSMTPVAHVAPGVRVPRISASTPSTLTPPAQQGVEGHTMSSRVVTAR